MKINLISINYKSSLRCEGWFEDFTITHDETKLTKYSYTVYIGNKVNNNAVPLFLGLTDIESIWVLEEKEV